MVQIQNGDQRTEKLVIRRVKPKARPELGRPQDSARLHGPLQALEQLIVQRHKEPAVHRVCISVC